MLKRILSLFLSIVMVLSMVPLQVLAEETVPVDVPEETMAVAAEETAPITMEDPTEPTETVPSETEIPETTVPTEETIPETTTPVEETVPQTTTPVEETVPETTTPVDETVPQTTAPVEESIPEETSESLVVSQEAAGDITGTCGASVSWTLSDTGVLTISGTGPMYNYSQSNAAPWFSERLSIREVVLDSRISSIGNYAFYYCVNLTDVSIPGSVKEIGSYAFAQCSALQSIVIPEGVTKLRDYAFYDCIYLSQVSLPDSLTTIANYAFSGCSSLQAIDIPAAVQNISYDVFSGCSALTQVVLPDGLKTMSSSLFSGCTSLETVTIPDSVTTISNDVFFDCVNLKGIRIPANVTSIGSEAFYNCKSLTAIELPKGLAYIDRGCFSGCTGLTQIQIPKGVASIYSSAFSRCTNLTSITLPAGLVTIKDGAFSGCTSLDNVVLPDGIATIDYSAFSSCTALKTISIPDTVTTLGSGVFSGCSALEEITLPARLQSIPESAFDGCTALNAIEIPVGVTSIGIYAFQDCSSLKEVILPNGVTGIPYYTFYGCSELAKVFIPATVEAIDQAAFGNCAKLTDITFAHTSAASLIIHRDAFYISYGNPNSSTPTTVSVPYARDIHSAIRDYAWGYCYRPVTFRSYASLPAVSLAIDAHPAQIEAGLEVAFSATITPWYSTSELLWEVENGTGEAQIDANGTLIGTKPGFVTVRCQSSDDAAVCDETQIEILKASATVSSISVRCQGDIEAEIELGDSVQMIADIRPGNAMNKSVTWEVENGTGTATITPDGVLKGLTCGTVTVYAMAQDGSEVVGSRVVEVMRYVTDMAMFLNGQEAFQQLGVDETALLTFRFLPEDANYPNGKVSIENGTGQATYSNGYLQGVAPGTVTITLVANDSRKLTIRKEIEIVGEKAAYAVAGGNLYYNTVTGTILGGDQTVTSANIPAVINGTRITAIAPKAFYNQDNLTSVTIPSSVAVIGQSAFYRCQNITSLRFIGNGLKIIGDSAFAACYGLVNLTIPSGVTSIGASAFYHCDGLVNLEIPLGVETIGSAAFWYLSNLKNLTIPGDYDTRGWLNDYGTLETVTFTGSRIREAIVTEYENGGFSTDSLPGRSARKVIISDSVTEIGAYAFRFEPRIEELVIGTGLKSIDKYAFQDCDNLRQVTLPEGIARLGEYAFASCDKLERINLPSSLEHIGRGCFSTNAPLRLIDLSMNPVKINGQQLQMAYALPDVLVSGTNQKNEIYWSFLYTWEDEEAGKPNPHDIAYIDNLSGMIRSHGSGVGEVTVLCWDEYTGASGVWTIEIASGIVIRTDRKEDFLTSGDVMELSAWMMPGDRKVSVEWSLREQDKDYASINSSGKLTAKSVTSAQQIEVQARPYDGGETATLKVWIVPRTTRLHIYDGEGDVSGLELDVDCAIYPSMQLTAVAYPEGALTEVRWETSDEEIASVDNGLVTFNGLGTVTISVFAADGSGKRASVTLNVLFQDSAKELTATVDAEDNKLYAGDKAQILIYGADPDVPIDPELLHFGIPNSQTDIATVDADGMITAGEKPGTATITASIKDDPLGRRVSIEITVVARQTEELLLHALADAPAQVQMVDINGNITTSLAQAASYTVLLKKSDVQDQAFNFVVIPEAFHSAGSLQPGKTDLKWASSNTKLATVSVQKDGTAIITVKQGMDGACVISAVTNDKAKIENRLTLNVQDFAPRMETLKPVLNTYLEQAAVLSLVPSYENWITGVTLLENGAVSSRLTAEYEDGVLTLSAKEPIPNSNLTLQVQALCADGETYTYTLNAKVKNSAPAVTIKQENKMDLFYTDSTAALKVTAKNAVVTHAELAETDDFCVVEYDSDTARLILRFSESYILDHSTKPDTKAELLVYLEGYEQPVKKSVTIATTTSKPAIQLTEKSSTVNIAISDDFTTTVGFRLKGSTELLDLSDAEVRVSASFAEAWLQGNKLALTLTGDTGGTATVYLRLDNWMNFMTLSHKVSVETKAPALKFGSSTVKLNRIFTDVEASADVVLSHSNLAIGDILFESTAKAGTTAREEADKLDLAYDPNTGAVIARIADPENIPKTGRYSFNAVGTLVDGTELKAATIKVTVEDAAPKVTLKTSTLKLNKVLFGHEVASSLVTLANDEDYTLVGFQPAEDWEERDLPLDIDFVDNQLTVKLLDTDVDAKTHTIKLYPILLHEATGQEKPLPKAVTLRVQIYSNDKISVALSSKGKLNTVDPNSEICYTVKKITNASGSITGVSLEGPDADLFDAVLKEDGSVALKLIPGESYSVKRTYKVQFSFSICGMDIPSAMLSFKVTQSSLTLKAASVSQVLYQSQTAPVRFRIELTDPEGAAIEGIALGAKTSQAFLDAMGTGEMDIAIAEDGRSAILEFNVRNAASLNFGKNYVIYLDVTAVGSAEDGKANQIKLTVNVAK